LVSAVVHTKNAQVPYGEVVHASIKICGKVSIASVTRVTGHLYPTCTIVHYKDEVADSPLQRFYKTYFQQATKSAVVSQCSENRVTCSWDYRGFHSDPSIVREFSPTLSTSFKHL